MNEWILPVTNRSQADVDYAKYLKSLGYDRMTDEQRYEYLSGLRGCVNRLDFERITNNIGVLQEMLEISTDFGSGEVPVFLTEDYFKSLHSAVQEIRQTLFIHQDTPPVPDLPWNTWQKYNAVERILADVHEVLGLQYNYFSGERYSGDTVGMIL